VIVQRTGKTPWSFKPDRQADFDEIARRASERGLPGVRYPDGWPAETYSLAPLRALTLADDQERVRALSAELFRTMFVDGRHLADADAVLDAAERAGMDRVAVAEGIGRQEVKDELRKRTDAALSDGITGVPTVAVGDQLFWGDDRLEDAAAGLTVRSR
jgi:2-hydroxychromene-2-carboxylate isomerase